VTANLDPLIERALEKLNAELGTAFSFRLEPAPRSGDLVWELWNGEVFTGHEVRDGSGRPRMPTLADVKEIAAGHRRARERLRAWAEPEPQRRPVRADAHRPRVERARPRERRARPQRRAGRRAGSRASPGPDSDPSEPPPPHLARRRAGRLGVHRRGRATSRIRPPKSANAGGDPRSGVPSTPHERSGHATPGIAERRLHGRPDGLPGGLEARDGTRRRAPGPAEPARAARPARPLERSRDDATPPARLRARARDRGGRRQP